MKKIQMSKKTILSTLMALVILCCSTASFFAISSYDIYMSQERPLIKTSPVKYNSEWIEEPFVMSKEILSVYEEFYKDTKIVVGSVYQERLVNGELQLVCLAEGSFEKYGSSGNDMYLTSDGAVFHLDLTALKLSEIYSGKDEIVDLAGYDNVVFFQASDSIYHYHCTTQTLRLLVTVEDVQGWKPLSNRVVFIIENNPIYYEAVAASGVSEYEQPKDKEAFSEWLNEKLSLKTSPDSKVLQECDVQSILLANGIGSAFGYPYDVVSQRVQTEYSDIITSGSGEELTSPGESSGAVQESSDKTTETVGSEIATDNGETTAPATDNGETTAPATDNGETTAPATDTPAPSDSSIPTEGAAEEASFPWIWVCIGGGVVIVVALAAFLLWKKKT